ncbi:hypothetical protein PUR21_00430 [Methylorubrum rhodesianum]|uniref:Uncharacterized protein n=1 Tax=Methylorubrum rhodesianum TaxID=29427 RepID=A0ABU9Z4G3_9HYPH
MDLRTAVEEVQFFSCADASSRFFSGARPVGPSLNWLSTRRL